MKTCAICTGSIFGLNNILFKYATFMQYILKTKSDFTLLHVTTEYILTVFYFSQILFVAFPWVITSTGPGGLMICVLIL